MSKWPQIFWSSSDFHTSSGNTKIFDSNLLLASGIVLSGNSYAEIDKLLISCEWLLFVSHLFMITNDTSFVHQWENFMITNR